MGTHIMTKLGAFLKAQPALCISLLAAAVTAFIIPPDKAYLGYCNYTVLIELFALMTAVAGLRSAGLFERATDVLLKSRQHPQAWTHFSAPDILCVDACDE